MPGDLMMGHPENILSIQQELPGVRLQNFIQAFQQGAFAHTVVAQDRQEFTGLQGEADAIQHLLIPPVTIPNVLYLNHASGLP